jgi:hypothetical protein
MNCDPNQLEFRVRRKNGGGKGKRTSFAENYLSTDTFCPLPLAKCCDMTRIRVVVALPKVAAFVAKERRRRGQGSSFVELVISIY